MIQNVFVVETKIALVQQAPEENFPYFLSLTGVHFKELL